MGIRSINNKGKIFFSYWAVIFVATHVPPSWLFQPQTTLPNIDKTEHYIAYFLWSLLLYRWICTLGVSFTQKWLAVGITLCLYASIDELTQPYFGRSAEWGDFLADLIGGICALALSSFIYRPKG